MLVDTALGAHQLRVDVSVRGQHVHATIRRRHPCPFSLDVEHPDQPDPDIATAERREVVYLLREISLWIGEVTR